MTRCELCGVEIPPGQEEVEGIDPFDYVGEVQTLCPACSKKHNKMMMVLIPVTLVLVIIIVLTCILG